MSCSYILGMINLVSTFLKTRYVHIAFAVALLLIYLATFYYSYYSDTFYGFYLFLLSLPLLFVARRILPSVQPDAVTDTSPPASPMRYHWLGLSIISSALLMMMNIPAGKMNPIQQTLGFNSVSTGLQMALLGLIILGLIHGFGGRVIPHRFTWKTQHTLLLGIVMLGGLIRIWDLADTYHVFLDEILFMGDVYYIHAENAPILYPNFAPTTDAYTFFQSVMVTLFGSNIVSQRLVSVIAGMIGLVVLYGFTRQLFSVRVALISALLYATLPVYVQFGRIGLYNVVDSIFGVLGFLYILRGMRSGRVSDFAFAGIAFGLTHYYYEGGRLFYTAYLVCWLLWCHIFSRRDAMFTPIKPKQWLAFVFCVAVLAVPIYHTLWQFDHVMTQRLIAVQTTDSVILDRVNTFLTGNNTGYLGIPLHQYVSLNGNDVFYQSPNAIILPILVPFFLLGFGRLVLQIHTIRGSLLIWWIIGTSVANNLISGSIIPQTPRHNVVYGVLMVVTALGIHTLWTLITSRVSTRFSRYIAIGFVGFLIAVSGIHIQHYFGEVVPRQYRLIYGLDANPEHPQPAFDDMIRRAIELPDNTTVIAFTDWEFPKSHKTIVPLYYGRNPEAFQVISREVTELERDYFESLPRNVNYVFAFTRYYNNRLVDLIEDTFVITQVEGSPQDVHHTVEMLFYHAPQANNPASVPSLTTDSEAD